MTDPPGWRARLSQRLDDPFVGPPFLFGVSFLESTIVPIPIEIALVPLMASARSRIWWIATIALAGTLAGALAGYAVGYFLFETIGTWILHQTETQAQFDEFAAQLSEQGFWVIVFVGISALPFKIAALCAGAIGFSFPLFCAATLLARMPRYYGLALLVSWFGEGVEDWLRENKRAGAILTAIALVALAAWYALA